MVALSITAFAVTLLAAHCFDSKFDWIIFFWAFNICSFASRVKELFFLIVFLIVNLMHVMF